VSPALLHQRCWNHDYREAVCRCPACQRHFCRECVTEHEARLLCAPCLATARKGVAARRGVTRRLVSPVAALSGVLLAWLILAGAGELLIEISARLERDTWHLR
jgi:hypothetical protein